MNKNATIHHATIEALSHDGRGITHVNNKITFLENALPGEEVNFVYTKQHSKFNTGKVLEILTPSPDRVTPICKHYEICGGCTLQHLNHRQQIEFKTQTIQEQLKHIGNIAIDNFSPPITGPTVGYRNKGRLSVKYVQKKQQVLIGFHEKNSSYVTETEECQILHPKVGKIIHLLRELIASLSIYQAIPQIEVACGNEVTTLVLRNLQNFSAADLKLIKEFSCEHQLQIYAQPGGIDSIQPITLDQISTPLSYPLPNYNLNILFAPTDFTQINPAINSQLVAQVLKLLELAANDTVLDLFCGIGNFTLPIATQCKTVIGIEGSKTAVARAIANAEYNQLNHAAFYVADLTKELTDKNWGQQTYDKILLDPPRTGAQEICSQINKFGAKKIVYVSCNPATFARDAKIIEEHGYKLQDLTLADMYPHTSHIEIVSVFSKV